jgi:anti-anti-sigma factor
MHGNVPGPDAASDRGYVARGAPVEIRVQTLADGTAHVSVWGEVDLATAHHLERVLADATRDGNHHLLVEFSHDSFIDSTGLNVLIQAARRSRTNGSSFRVTTENAHTRRVIETMGLAEGLGF